MKTQGSGKTAFLGMTWLPWLVVIVGLAITWVGQSSERNDERRMLQAEFDFRAAQIADLVAARLSVDEQMLQGIRSLFAVSGHVERRDFAEYVKQLQLAKRFPGVVAVGYSPALHEPDLPGQTAQVRKEGFPDYRVWPEGERADYAPRTYLEPFSGKNLRAFGFDALSDPTRRAAMELARDTDLTIMTGSARLVQDDPGPSHGSVMLFLPVYRMGMPHDTIEHRRAALMGWVDAALRKDELMQSLLEAHMENFGDMFDLAIGDAEETTPAELIRAAAHAGTAHEARYTASQSLQLFGRTWNVVIASRPAFDAREAGKAARIVAAIGVAASLVIGIMLQFLLKSRSLAHERAESIDRVLRQSEVRRQKLNRALTLLGDCTIAMVRSDDELALLHEVCRLAVEKGGYLLAWVGYVEHDVGRSVRPVAQAGFKTSYLDGIRICWSDNEFGQGPAGKAIRGGQTQTVQNTQTDPNYAPWREAAQAQGFQSTVALPLKVDGRILGVLSIYAAEPGAFDEDEVKLLEELAEDLAFGVQMLRTRAAHAAAEERAAFLLQFDKLTGLPNRLLLRDRFMRAVDVSEKKHGFIVGLLYVNLDGFSRINEGLQHESGDALLRAVAERILATVPDGSTVSRHASDEFIILLTHERDPSHIAGAATALGEAIAQTFRVGQDDINITASIGIALYPLDGSDFDELLRAADTAMRSAKDAGRNTSRFFERRMNEDASAQLRIAGQFNRALEHGEFVLHYQPQILLDSGKLIGAEALIRWQHPEEGLIPPGRFIGVAEQSGHIVRIGEWALREAARQAKAWLAATGEGMVVAVNVSELQFRRGNFGGTVQAALRDTGLPSQLLELELTESILLQQGTVELIAQLKGLGLQLSIDDFGTGYSSLAYLKQLPVDKLKIDQSFVRDMLESNESALIVKSIIQLAHGLRRRVIAEGVETEAQMAYLREAGCDEAQGYYYAKPLPPSEFAATFLGLPLQLPTE